MAVNIKTKPELVRPAGSHWLELEKTSQGEREPFSKEELYPICELDAPRVGRVRATFSVDRYVASSWDEATETSSSVWSDWRIHLRDVRTPDEGRPDLPHLGREAAGVGDATRRAISEACVPIIREWLEGSEYQRSRRKTAAQTIRREFDYPRTYTLENARRTLERLGDELGPMERKHLRAMVELLEQAAAGLEREAMAD